MVTIEKVNELDKAVLYKSVTTGKGHGRIKAFMCTFVVVMLMFFGLGGLTTSASSDVIPSYDVTLKIPDGLDVDGNILWTTWSVQRVRKGEVMICVDNLPDSLRGCWLEGWYEDASMLIPCDEDSPINMDKTVYAKVRCRVVYYPNNGEASMVKIVDYGAMLDRSVPEDSRIGCVFRGWFTDRSVRMPMIATGSQTFYAIWRREVELCMWLSELHDWFNYSTLQESDLFGNFELPEMNECYDGWWIDQSCTLKWTQDLFSSYDEIPVLYASKFRTITFDLGGDTAVQKIPFAVLSTATLNECPWEWVDHEFVGWTTVKDGTTVEYSDECCADSIHADCTLYAVWNFHKTFKNGVTAVDTTGIIDKLTDPMGEYKYEFHVDVVSRGSELYRAAMFYMRPEILDGYRYFIFFDIYFTDPSGNRVIDNVNFEEFQVQIYYKYLPEGLAMDSMQAVFITSDEDVVRLGQVSYREDAIGKSMMFETKVFNNVTQ